MLRVLRLGGSRPPDFREFLQGAGLSNPPVWRRVVGYVFLDW